MRQNVGLFALFSNLAAYLFHTHLSLRWIIFVPLIQIQILYCRLEMLIISSNMQKTFDYYRSTNSRFAATLDQEDNYGRYLKRIEDIVNKKPQPDFSMTHYMGFLNKCKQLSRNHKSHEYLAQISTDNQILLDKIVNAKKRKPEKNQERYTVAMHEKRCREQIKINEENRKIALRVVRQGSKLNLRASDWSLSKESPRRVNEKTFYQSRVKQRKLPKLICN